MNDRTHRPVDASGLCLAAFLISIPLAYALIFALSWNRVGLKDHDQFLVFHELQYWNADLFAWEKEWTPLLGGGLSLAADPQVPFLSLTMALGHLLGPFAGLRAGTVLYFAAGWIGAYLYAGLMVRKRLIRSLAASLFIGNGFFVCRLAYGHIDHIPFLTLPLVLWSLHKAAEGKSLRGRTLIALLLGGLVALAVDGSPVAIVHWLLWIGVYAAVLAGVARTPAPVLVLIGAAGTAALLDAGYLWPMLSAQSEFPRLRPLRFTNPAVLLWFMLVPARGKLIPAPANGHEFSVFIGPVIAWLIFRFRKEAARKIPRSVWTPCLITAAVSFVLGMGSLRPLGVPAWLSPFDLLSHLPGFRSLSVTGRFWGFLALPLSLLGAGALDLFSREAPPARLRVGCLAAFAFQIGFQAVTVGELLLPSRRYNPVPSEWRTQADQTSGLVRIEYVYCGDEGFTQGAYLTPTRGVIDCYNHGDFIRPRMKAGRSLVRSMYLDGRKVGRGDALDAGFVSWNEICLRAYVGRLCEAAFNAPDRRSGLPAAPKEKGASEVGITLNQAYHRYWSPSAGKVVRTGTGNLGLVCRGDDLESGSHGRGVYLRFHDPWSARGARLSTISWPIWALCTLLLARRRGRVQFGKLLSSRE